MLVGFTPAVQLRMAPRAENLALARLALAGVGSLAGATDTDIADLKLAVTEACTNAILHGYGNGAAGDLVVRYRVADGTVEVEVEDDGVGFDPDDPGARASESGGEGMGLLIIRTLTDTLEIESDASGSRVFFSKSVGGDAEDVAAPAGG
jgi:anti-sigma regulatory factor (Ser/Thr protein kinase)